MTFELDLGNLIVRRKEKSMFNFLVTAEGGLTTAGYAVSVIAVLILIILVAVLLQKNTSALKFTTQQLVTCAVALALAYVTSYIKIFKLPFGGSVTLFSMLFIVLIGYWYGIGRNSYRSCIWDFSVPPGAICPFIFSGML